METKQNTIQIDIMYYYSDEAETLMVYDEEAMREEFESQLNQLINS